MRGLNRKSLRTLSLTWVAILVGCGGSSPEEEAAKEVGKGDSFFNSGFYREALTHYQASLDHLSDNARIHLSIGKCQERLGLMTQALESYDTAIKKDPNLMEAYRGKAFLFLREHRIPKAEELAEELRTREGMEGLVHYLDGEIALAGNDKQKAIASFQEALSKDPGFKQAAQSLARLFQERGQSREAIEVLTKLAERDPSDTIVVIQLAELHEQQGENTKAIEVLSNLAQQQPQNARVRSRLAQSYLNEEMYDDAERVVKEAISLDPNDPTGLYVSGKLALRRGDLERALTDLESASNRYPEEQTFRQAYRQAQVAAGKIKDRVKIASEKIRTEGESQETLLALADAYLCQGELDRALSEIRKILALDPDNTEARILEILSQFFLGDRVSTTRGIEGLETVDDGRVLATKGLLANERDLLAKGVTQLKSASSTEVWGDFYDALGHMANRKFEPGLKRLHASIEENEDFLLPRYELAQFYIGINEPVLATVIYQRITEEFPDSRRSQILLARVLSETGKLDRAEVVVGGLLEKEPTFVQAKYLLGTIQLRKREFKLAQETFADLVESASQDRKDRLYFRSFLAKTSIYAQDYERASAEYDSILQKAPENSAAHLEKTLAEMAANQGEKALQTCEAGILAATEARILHVVKAVVLQQLGRAEEALVAYEEVGDLDEIREEDTGRLIALRVGLLMSAGKFDEAREKANGGGINPSRVDYLLRTIERAEAGEVDVRRLNLGLLFTYYLWPSAALSVYSELSQKYPNDELLLVHLGEAQDRVGLYSEAYETFSKGVALDPRDTYFLRMRGRLASRLGQFEEATRDFLTCLARAPQDPTLQFELAQVYEKEGLIDDAVATYKRVLKLDSTGSLAAGTANNLAWLLSQEEDTRDEALKYAKTALELSSVEGKEPDGNVLDTIGWVYFLRGDSEEAKKHVGLALRFIPNQPTITYHLGRICEELGEKKEAIHHYINALNTNPNFPEAEDTRPRIAVLRSQIGD